ncbi:thiamine pyrophosphokinase [Cladorrhinum samala]|uniref:Thiamine pyrophosphokinase n=1 Tax=Cladorrhinum samala TaxID=585594 RepID=A0AAV9H976_9PEZI|nr:thiamine pyrophosphokinase [Cladorrhinum samala]
MSATINNEDEVTIEWNLTTLVRPGPIQQHNDQTGVALIVLNQPLEKSLHVIRTLWNNASIRVAADGGANAIYEVAGQHGDTTFDNLQAIVGDLDSLDPITQEYYTSRTKPAAIIRQASQESTDFGKAINYVRQNSPAGPIDIVAIGGLGGRVDQGLSQLHHLYLFQKDEHYKQGRIYLFSGESLTFLLKGDQRKVHKIRVRDEGQLGEEDAFGKHVGILPVGEKSRIWTKGLEWDVQDWETGFGGRVSTSNHILPETKVVEVRTARDVLFTVALRDGKESGVP